jgi:putative FmdB family regulatory protein
MPRYDFACKCGKEVEITLTFTEPHVVTCGCGQKMRKVIKATPTIFQGTGWGAKP